jgi:hypothetical protein
VGVAVKAAIRQTQHASVQAGQQRLANFPLSFPIGTQIGGDNRVTGALDEYGTLGLWIARMTGAAARVFRLDLYGYFRESVVFSDGGAECDYDATTCILIQRVALLAEDKL